MSHFWVKRVYLKLTRLSFVLYVLTRIWHKKLNVSPKLVYFVLFSSRIIMSCRKLPALLWWLRTKFNTLVAKGQVWANVKPKPRLLPIVKIFYNLNNRSNLILDLIGKDQFIVSRMKFSKWISKFIKRI